MKIIILQDCLRMGGTEAQALALGSQWMDLGHDVRLITFRQGGELAKQPAAKKISTQVLQPVLTWIDSWAPGLDKAVAEHSPDVVVAFGREANAKLYRLGKLFPRPVLVATLRSGRDQPARFWRALRKADAVIANAQWAADEAAAQGVAQEKLHTIYSGLVRDMRVADPVAARAEWRKRAHTPEGAVVFLCVAGFRRGKGQDALLRAAAQLPPSPPWQMWFVGTGTWHVPYMRLAMQLKLKDQVRFTGALDDPAPLFAAADVAALASFAEALPNFLIEAQSAGLPVVSTAVGGTTECFIEGQTGLAVPVSEPAALTAALSRAINDAAWRQAAREPAIARARELFNANRNALKWIEIFEDLKKKTN